MSNKLNAVFDMISTWVCSLAYIRNFSYCPLLWSGIIRKIC